MSSVPHAFDVTPQAQLVLEKRYLMKDPKTQAVTETLEDMLNRVASALARVEKERYMLDEEDAARVENQFRTLLFSKAAIPAGRTLANAGTRFMTIPNCVVLSIDDDLASKPRSIFNTLKDAAALQQAGSGIGFCFSTMRPAGMATERSGGESSGPISFLKVYNESFRCVKQRGRHGANMATFSVDHPDILRFIDCKKIEGSINCFNVSVLLTDKFMQQVVQNLQQPWQTTWKGVPMPMHDPRDGEKPVRLTASQLFDRIVEGAWKNGEPGVLYVDRAEKDNMLPQNGQYSATNPCGEQWLQDGDNCNLGSINLREHLKPATPRDNTHFSVFEFDDGEGKTYQRVGGYEVDKDKLRSTVRTFTRMLDNVIDTFEWPRGLEERCGVVAKSNRRIGMSIMGWADMLYAMRIPYGSDTSIALARELMDIITETAEQASEELAEEKGVFPNWKKSRWNTKEFGHRKQRNLQVTTVAPTGSISMIHDVSGGIEPYFALAFYREGVLGQSEPIHFFNKDLEVELDARGLKSDPDVFNYIQTKGTLRGCPKIDDGSKEAKKHADLLRVYVTAMDISPDAHCKMQAAWQGRCRNSISKTINLPNSATIPETRQVLIDAWKAGCKGCTVYRDGSRNVQVLNLNDKEKKEEKPVENGTQLTEQVLKEAVAQVVEQYTVSNGHAETENKEYIQHVASGVPHTYTTSHELNGHTGNVIEASVSTARPPVPKNTPQEMNGLEDAEQVVCALNGSCTTCG